MNPLEQQLARARRDFRAKLRRGAFAALALFALALPLALFTHSVAFRITPPLAAEGAAVSVSGGIGLAVSSWGRAYWLGDSAALRVESPGYVTRTLAVDSRQDVLSIALTEAPVKVVITTEPALAQTRWRVNGDYVDTAAQLARTMPPGAIRIDIEPEFYAPETLHIEVETGRDFARHVNLTPVAGSIRIRSEPGGARVMFDGVARGVTPLVLEAVAGGVHQLHIALDGYQPIEEDIAITHRLANIERDYRLQPRRSEARIRVSPPGGVLRVNGVAVESATDGAATLPLATGKQHSIEYAKPGYFPQSREVLLAPNQRAEIAFQLEAEMGEVVVRSEPPAELFVNGKAAGVTPQTLRLQALPQQLSLRRAGYRSAEVSVTPRAAAPLLIDEQLQTERDARLAQAPPVLTAAAGIKMKLFTPRADPNHRFTMGAPRGEKHRRANEFERRVALTKAFYVSVTEITEEQFANYRPGQVAGKHLPARNLSWLDAVRFCNWLSAQDGLRPAYQLAAGQLAGFDPTADGYRLLSEAEWEWLARVAGRVERAKFVWGDDATIPAGSGNFADESAKGGVPTYIPRYRDGFAGVAPVASFAADAAGLYDMAGNVSEWVHDRYDLQPPAPGQVETNPFGGRHGDGRVVKGANFRSASVTGLRSSFRDGLLSARDDVGFRIARYVYGKDE